MKKLVVLALGTVMALTLAACGGNGNNNNSNNSNNGNNSNNSVAESKVESKTESQVESQVSENKNPYNLDMKSTETQPMSKERASKEVLGETANTYFGGLNYFEDTEQANLTYDDVVTHIGVDPSEYKYDENLQAELYIWYADGDDKASLNVWFVDGKINASGAYNL
ncbi:MAG: hypothetical protein PUG48_06810 [Clostridia bacterium]|nr:hypothetical protein [Clostridia bacterium]